MIDKDILKRNFSKKASIYDRHAMVQKHMAKRLISNIDFDSFHKEKVILEVGPGTGYMTRLIEEKVGENWIDAVDIAEGMVKKARDIFKDRINFICDDIESMRLPRQYDLIASNATFQWLEDFKRTTKKLIHGMKAGGELLFSTFGEETFKELHSSYSRAKESLNIEDGSRLGQTFYSKNDIRDILVENMIELGIKVDISIQEEEVYEYFDSVKSFLYSVKRIGAGNTDSSSSNISALREMIGIYERDYSEHKKIRVTYHCIYVRVRRD